MGELKVLLSNEKGMDGRGSGLIEKEHSVPVETLKTW